MFITNKVTQRDIAKACSVHASTICLALKNSPSIPIETRKRIQREAARLGYRPNATAQNLAFMRQDRKGGGTLPIAWINQEEERDHWRTDPSARIYFEASSQRAAELGYHLEDVWTREPGMRLSRIIQILKARGIERVIFPVHGAVDLSILSEEWGEFSTVGLNDHRLSDRLDLVCADYYQNAATILRRIEQQNGGRIGMIMTPEFDESTNGLVHSCLLRFQRKYTPDERIPVCFVDASEDGKENCIQEWMLRYRPDSIISYDPSLKIFDNSLTEGRNWYRWHDPEDQMALGACDSAAEAGVVAVEYVIEKSRRYDRGLGEATHLRLIKGGRKTSLLSQVELESTGT
ncbi:LacI family DNA-binding transcriptional regulator [Puniceicoccaceae bacterium K14]|nr:LacI family DNA-binding transcriptional regulator [Puniceicoccaceae bacterium K14]